MRRRLVVVCGAVCCLSGLAVLAWLARPEHRPPCHRDFVRFLKVLKNRSASLTPEQWEAGQGMRRAEVESYLGEPASVETGPDGVCRATWHGSDCEIEVRYENDIVIRWGLGLGGSEPTWIDRWHQWLGW
jgi:hypothetical protein